MGSKASRCGFKLPTFDELVNLLKSILVPILALSEDLMNCIINTVESKFEILRDPASFIFNILGDMWNTLVDIADNFAARVLGVLGGTWNTLIDIAEHFSEYVWGVIGETWDILLDIAEHFPDRVLGALGDTWEWLQEFIADPMSKLALDIASAVEAAFEYLTEKWFEFLDAAWDSFETSIKYFTNKVLILIGTYLDEFDDADRKSVV